MFILRGINSFVLFAITLLQKLSSWIINQTKKGSLESNITLYTIYQAGWAGIIAIWFVVSGAVFIDTSYSLKCMIGFGLYAVAALLTQYAVQRKRSSLARIVTALELVGIFAFLSIFDDRIAIALGATFMLLLAVSFVWGKLCVSIYFGWWPFKKLKQRRDEAAATAARSAATPATN